MIEFTWSQGDFRCAQRSQRLSPDRFMQTSLDSASRRFVRRAQKRIAGSAGALSLLARRGGYLMTSLLLLG